MQKTAPKISVIVPVYRTEAYLDRCLASIAAQTLPDIEVLCVNDGSPDGSGAIIDAWVAKDDRFRHIVHEQNRGTGAARNTGLTMATSDYVASVDSDDWVMPEMLELAFTATEAGHHDIVSFGFQRVNEQGEVLSTHSRPGRLLISSQLDSIFGVCNPAFWNKIWRARLFTENGIYFPERISGQDMATTPRILSKMSSMRTISDVLYNYLSRDTSVTNSFNADRLMDYVKGFDVLYEFLVEEGLWEAEKANFVEKAVLSGLTYHATNLLGSDLSEKEKASYLRHLVLLKNSYLDSNHRLFNLRSDELFQLLVGVPTGGTSRKLTISH